MAKARTLGYSIFKSWFQSHCKCAFQINITLWGCELAGMGWKISFWNSVFKRLTSNMKIGYHFKAASCPWANDMVRRLSRELLQISKALLPQRKLSTGQRPAIEQSIWNTMIQSPMKRLEKNKTRCIRCPTKVFTGMRAPPFLAHSSPFHNFQDLKDIDLKRCNSVVF